MSLQRTGYVVRICPNTENITTGLGSIFEKIAFPRMLHHKPVLPSG